MNQRLSAIAESKSLLSCLPFGVGHDREGVCLLVKIGPYRVLLDCGLSNLAPLTAGKTPPADLVFCSHAHADHARGLLALHKAYPQLPVYASEVTVRLLSLNWPDARAEIPDFCRGWPWRSPIELFDDLSAEIFPAGHLPGAAVVVFTYKTPKRSYKVMYTGDFSLSNFQLVEGLSIDLLRGLAPDVLIVEGSYGTQRHPHRRQQEKQLMNRIHEALSAGQNVLLPVPVLGSGQEILKLLRSHHQFTGRDIDIWVEGQIADACDRYLDLLVQFPVSVQNFAKHQPLFWDERVCPRLRRLSDKDLPLAGEAPAIVLTDRLDRLQKYLQGGRSWLLLVPEAYRDRVPSDSARWKAFQRSRFLTIETYLLAEHSDSRNTTQLIHNLRPQHVMFVHGSPMYLADLTSLEELQNRYQLHSPAAGTLVELPIGDRFIQPNPPSPTHYEGELNEAGASVTVTFNDAITRDPRWSSFADTGLVEARWQGEDLLLRGVSQRELLSDSHTRASKGIEEIDCCRICLHYKSHHCWNPTSPLYSFKVVPEGYCPVFEGTGEKSEG
jgi:Cft2 family RNA processing exonuclease